jgi:hypothetical protein
MRLTRCLLRYEGLVTKEKIDRKFNDTFLTFDNETLVKHNQLTYFKDRVTFYPTSDGASHLLSNIVFEFMSV